MAGGGENLQGIALPPGKAGVSVETGILLLGGGDNWFWSNKSIEKGREECGIQGKRGKKKKHAKVAAVLLGDLSSFKNWGGKNGRGQEKRGQESMGGASRMVNPQ